MLYGWVKWEMLSFLILVGKELYLANSDDLFVFLSEVEGENM